MVNFHVLHDPLVPYDEQNFNDRNSNTVGSDLYTYPGLLNDQDGGRILDQHHFYLTYTYTRLRTAGYVFTSGTGPLVPAGGLTPVYSCVTSGGAHFASNMTTCEGKGTQVALLGYGLAH